MDHPTRPSSPHDRDDLFTCVLMLLESAGAPASVADVVARNLLSAELAGHPSHGILQVVRYLALIDSGAIRPAARPTLERRLTSSAQVDGHWGFGFLAAELATDAAVELALEHGACVVGITHANHLGRLGAYVRSAADRGVALQVMVGGLDGPRIAAHGARGGTLGTNAIALGFPGLDEAMVLDFSTSMVSGGAVELRRRQGRRLDQVALLEADGTPTDDPDALARGGYHRAFGDAKGSGLNLYCELLGRVLPGSRRGATFVGVATGALRATDRVTAEASRLFDQLRALPSATTAPVRIPGDRPRAAARSAADEVWLPQGTLDALASLQARLEPDAAERFQKLLTPLPGRLEVKAVGGEVP